MATSSRANAIDTTSNEKIFISWKEKVVNESHGDKRIEFFLQLKTFSWVLAVIGVMTNHHHMEYVVDPAFYFSYARDVTGIGNGAWKKRCEVVAWLQSQICNRPFNNNNGAMPSDENGQICQVMVAGDFSKFIDSEGAKASLAFPSGFADAYSIPSTAQIFLKHGARKFEVIVEDGYLTQGWNYFVSEHDIQYGFAVKFHFVGFSTFEIEIFDQKRCKKVYPWSSLEWHEWV